MSFRYAEPSDELKIATKTFTLLTRGEREALYRLTSQNDSSMKASLRSRGYVIAVIGRIGEKIVAWAAIDPKDLSLDVYVDPSYRGRGIGKKLGMEAIVQVRKLKTKGIVNAGSDTSQGEALYKSIGLEPLYEDRGYHFFYERRRP